MALLASDELRLRSTSFRNEASVVVVLTLSFCFFMNSYPQFEQVDLLHRGHRTQKARKAKTINDAASMNGDTVGEKRNATPCTANAAGINVLRYLK